MANRYIYTNERGLEIRPQRKPALKTKNSDRINKIRLIELEKSSGCILCGDLSDPNFHHVDPEEKLFSISQAPVGLTFEKLAEELDKCVVLCSSCHVSVHHSPELLDRIKRGEVTYEAVDLGDDATNLAYMFGL